jgi:hypothetical protein
LKKNEAGLYRGALQAMRQRRPRSKEPFWLSEEKI